MLRSVGSTPGKSQRRSIGTGNQHSNLGPAPVPRARRAHPSRAAASSPPFSPPPSPPSSPPSAPPSARRASPPSPPPAAASPRAAPPRRPPAASASAAAREPRRWPLQLGHAAVHLRTHQPKREALTADDRLIVAFHVSDAPLLWPSLAQTARQRTHVDPRLGDGRARRLVQMPSQLEWLGWAWGGAMRGVIAQRAMPQRGVAHRLSEVEANAARVDARAEARKARVLLCNRDEWR